MGSEPIGGVLAIEVELRKERASTLKRVGHHLEALIAQLTDLRPRLQAATGNQRLELSAEYRRLWAEAEKQRWYLVVQREAMGLSDHGAVEELYPLPPPPPR